MTPEERYIFVHAIKKYGPGAQILMVVEEMSELTKAICKMERNPSIETKLNVIEEMADVEIMIDQLKIIFECTEGLKTF